MTKAERPLWKEKLRILRKRWWKKSYSQNGEDTVLLAVFDGRKTGCYVDVGSFHPRQYSNTRALHERGWHGVNIDISPRKQALFAFDRPRDVNLCCAVSDHPGELTAFIFGRGSALDTTDRATAEEWAERFGLPFKEIKVPCRTLTDILEESDLPQVDYLNIDVEGAEMAVLNGLDFSKFRPHCISIEIHGELEEAESSEPYKLLRAQGYRLHAWVRPTFLFVMPETGTPA